MKVNGRNIRPIWLDDSLKIVKVIDQRRLPHEFVIADLRTVDDVIDAIQKMYVRGAPLIGVTAAYGVYLAALGSVGGNIENGYLIKEGERLKAARPTAVNLSWAVDTVLSEIVKRASRDEKVDIAWKEAERIAATEAERCCRIGENGSELIEKISLRKKGRPVNILTHCNAGWLACIEYGTATAPIYAAFQNGIDIHVWVDETRPLNQGARLTAWEMLHQGVKHTIITDNTAGHIMQHRMVDMVIVGSDRTTRNGDVANKIGTYLVALAAKDNGIPFYVALPSSSFDWTIKDGINEIPIEERDPDEVKYVQGLNDGRIRSVLVPSADSPAANFAFDVTPARLVTAFITERGICPATEAGIRNLFPDKGSSGFEQLDFYR